MIKIMFRKMRRFKQEISQSECLELLTNEKRGVLSVIGDDGYPYGIPLNHYYNKEKNCIYFHGAKRDTRLMRLLQITKCHIVLLKNENKEKVIGHMM